MTRIIATAIRIAWAVYPRNISVGIAAMIFVYAGIILLFITNLFFAQRILRAQHPRVGWSKPATALLPILIALIILTILALIAAVIVQFYVPDGEAIALPIQKYGSTLFAVMAFLPIPIVAISALARLHPGIRMTKPVDKFGSGRMRSKIAIVLLSALVLTLGAAFRAATTLLSPIPLTTGSPPHPAPSPPYLSKPAFYTVNFGLEIAVVLAWLALRIDRRFYVPDGARGPGSYAGGFVFAGEPGHEKARSTRHLTSARTSWASLHDPAGAGSRHSMASTRARTKSLESRVSWGGVSREQVAPMWGEDGVGVVPYSAFDEGGAEEDWGDVGVAGAEKEMGWDPKSGKWALRPISRRVSLGSEWREGGGVDGAGGGSGRGSPGEGEEVMMTPIR